jgi:cytidylate kinase
MMLITIDGPAGTGKGTVAQAIAKQLNLNYLDSGAIYRVIAYLLLDKDISFDNEVQAIKEIELADLDFSNAEILLNKKNITSDIRTEKIASSASIIATSNIIRESILDKQRRYLKHPGLVAEGRDMGTVVFPEARYKFYLNASVAERAQRRYKQLISKGFDVNITSLEKEISDRDERDQNRSVSPLVPAANSVIIDTTNLSPEEVISLLLTHINK